MSRPTHRTARISLAVFSALACGALQLLAAGNAQAQQVGFVANPTSVGGVSIDPQGVLRKQDQQQQAQLRQVREKFLHDAPANMQGMTKTRRVSLRQLQEAAFAGRKDPKGQLPEEVRFLAGLQRIQYVLVYPELKDIVLVGPAEGWKVGPSGDVVGVTTGRPVLHLDDLLVALRTAARGDKSVISCSIDPTAEGVQNWHNYQQKHNSPVRPGEFESRAREMTSQAQQQIGLQQITLNGIDPTSRFAQVLVVADYQMKRLAMGFDPSPVKGMPSYLSMISGGRGKNVNPRWWLEDDYQPLSTDGDGLSWEIRGQGVKAMTEEEVTNTDGTRRATGKVDPLAQRWAASMTAHYDELSAKEPVFGQLRNCMDLAVIGALIVSEDLSGKAGLDLSQMLTSDSLTPEKFEAPRHVPTLANALRKGGGLLISASGGVSLNPWRVAAQREKTAQLAPVHDKSQPPAGAAWWWN
ncbi:MAG: DUF1598 domain-containing protein [Planctomycetia bacterium]|nr:DUF1598 domain-containing protein [Planctomycetia bacterium]